MGPLVLQENTLLKLFEVSGIRSLSKLLFDLVASTPMLLSELVLTVQIDTFLVLNSFKIACTLLLT